MNKDQTYNIIGKNYNQTRKPDIRIYNYLKKLLSCDKQLKIIDIGAGTGNYTYLFAEDNYLVDAIEPSSLMQSQGKKHDNINWMLSAAENIPIKNNFYDGAICTLAYHHFDSIEKSFSEIHRVLKQNKNFVIFTADPRKTAHDCWLNYYFSELVEKAKNKLPNIESVIALLEKTFNDKPELISFDLPSDLTDSFFYSAWKYPEKYLDENFRNGISSFAAADKNKVEELINKLKIDLDNKNWDDKFGYIRKLEKYNCGYYFIVVKKK